MADIVAVLRKTIDNLGENTPEMRERVYDKARATIDAKLAALDPPPPQSVIDRQKQALEDAVAVVRREYDDPPDESDDEFESLMATLSGEPGTGENDRGPGDAASPDMDEARSAPAGAEDVSAYDEDAAKAAFAGEDETSEPGEPPESPLPPEAPAEAAEAQPATDQDGLDRLTGSAAAPEPAGAAMPVRGARGKRRARTGLVAAAIALLVVAGGSYAVWLNKDDFGAMFAGGSATGTGDAEEGSSQQSAASREESAEVDAEEAAAPEGPADGEASGDGTDDAEEDIAATLGEDQPEAAGDDDGPETGTGSDAEAEAEKFTQRLLPDGSEVDAGPAEEEDGIGEGSSIASAAPAEAAGEEDEAQGAEDDVAQVGANGGDEETALAVGQRAIFYEERTSDAEGSAQQGSTVWTLVEDSGSGETAGPAIRAEVTIPEKDLQLRLTIRRNEDETLPASHIVEMIFLTPDSFEGGAIDNVSRVNMKDSEQAPGNPLLGIPAKIADGFFLLALTDTAQEVEANLTLMRRQSWIDIPLVYQSGRRALVTLEKGVPGDRVFQEALQSWTEEDGDSEG